MLRAAGGKLFGVNDKGMVLCCELATGKMIYNERLTDGVSASPVLVDGRMVAVDEKGRLFVIEPDASSGKPKVLSKVDLGEPVIASPAVGGGRLWVRGEQNLFCIGARKD